LRVRSRAAGFLPALPSLRASRLPLPHGPWPVLLPFDPGAPDVAVAGSAAAVWRRRVRSRRYPAALPMPDPLTCHRAAAGAAAVAVAVSSPEPPALPRPLSGPGPPPPEPWPVVPASIRDPHFRRCRLRRHRCRRPLPVPPPFTGAPGPEPPVLPRPLPMRVQSRHNRRSGFDHSPRTHVSVVAGGHGRSRQKPLNSVLSKRCYGRNLTLRECHSGGCLARRAD
jgi:hypothetical protein